MNKRKLAFIIGFSSKYPNAFLFSVKSSIVTGYTKPYVLIWFPSSVPTFSQTKYMVHLHLYVSSIEHWTCCHSVMWLLGGPTDFNPFFFTVWIRLFIRSCYKVDVILLSAEILLKLKIAKNLHSVWALSSEQWTVNIKKYAHERQTLIHISSEIMIPSYSVFPCANKHGLVFDLLLHNILQTIAI